MGFGPKPPRRQMIAALAPGLLGVRASHHVNGLKPLCIGACVAVGVDDALVFLPILVRIDKAHLESMR